MVGKHFLGASIIWLTVLLTLALVGVPLGYVLILFFPLGFIAVAIISALWDWVDRRQRDGRFPT